MWTAERRPPLGADSLRLLRAPLARFDDGRARAPEAWYRALPLPAPGALHNRFAGDHLLYGSGNGWWNDAGNEHGTIFVVPWRGEPDAVVVGASGGDLHFSGVRLGARLVVVQRFVLDSASQGRLGATGSSIGRTARAGTRARVSSGCRCAARGGRGGSTWSRGRRRSCS